MSVKDDYLKLLLNVLSWMQTEIYQESPVLKRPARRFFWSTLQDVA